MASTWHLLSDQELRQRLSTRRRENVRSRPHMPAIYNAAPASCYRASTGPVVMRVPATRPYAAIVDLSWSASNCRSSNAACVQVPARSSRPRLSLSVSARQAEMIASLAYCQNSSVFDMAPSRCPDLSQSNAAPLRVSCPEKGAVSYYNFLCNYAAVTLPNPSIDDNDGQSLCGRLT
jgi:hypothetical protein